MRQKRKALAGPAPSTSLTRLEGGKDEIHRNKVHFGFEPAASLTPFSVSA